MSNDVWKKMIAEGNIDPSRESKEERTARITSDPAPKWKDEPVRNYPTVEKHYIICVDEAAANQSMPEAFLDYGEPHKVGGVLVSDRKEIPAGWIKMPPKGTPVDSIKKSYPALYDALTEKKVTVFR